MIPEIFGKKNNFIKAENTKNHDLIKFLNEGEIKVSTKFTYPELTSKGTKHPKAGQFREEMHFEIEFSGKTWNMRLNSNSYKNLSEKWGVDTKEWIGKKASITLMPMMNGDGKWMMLNPED